MTDKARILSLAQALILARLQDRAEVLIPCIGLFRSRFREEYILHEGGKRTLMPPSVSLEFLPTEYLLATHRYTQLDFDAPDTYFDTEFVANLSLLHNLNEAEVATTLQEYCEELLNGLFKGRRVSFLEMGDLFVSEEEIGILLLNFIPNPDFLTSLNQVFSVYKPTLLPEGVAFADMLEVDESIEPAPKRQYVISEAAPETVAPPVVEGPESDPKPLPEPAPVEVVAVDEPAVPEAPAERKRKFPWWVVILLLILVGVGLLLWFGGSRKPAPVAEVSEPVAPVDTIVEAPKVETPAPVLYIDTVRVARGGSLAELARQYYGDVYKWVYIYMANKDSIPNPDNLVYNQQLVIPNLEPYHLKGDSIEALQEAKAWATVILNRKFRSYEEQRQELVLP